MNNQKFVIKLRNAKNNNMINDNINLTFELSDHKYLNVMNENNIRNDNIDVRLQSNDQKDLDVMNDDNITNEKSINNMKKKNLFDTVPQKKNEITYDVKKGNIIVDDTSKIENDKSVDNAKYVVKLKSITTKKKEKNEKKDKTEKNKNKKISNGKKKDFKDFVFKQISSKISVQDPEYDSGCIDGCKIWRGYKKKHKLYNEACHIVKMRNEVKHYISPQKYIYNYINYIDVAYNDLINMKNRVRNIDNCQNRGMCCLIDHIEEY